MSSFNLRLGKLFSQRLQPGEGAQSAAMLLGIASIFNRNATAPERLNLDLIILGLALLLTFTAPSTRPNGLRRLPDNLQRFTERELMLPGLILGLSGLYTQSLPMLVTGLILTMSLYFITRNRQ